jgi:hypothetical protein
VIDLGQKTEFEVKWDGNVYLLREPTAKEMSAYQQLIENKKSDSEAVGLLIQFVSTLGLPEAVASDLPVSKLSLLVESLIGQISKKN